MKKILVCIMSIVLLFSGSTITTFAEDINANSPTLAIEIDVLGEFDSFFGSSESSSQMQRSINSSVGEASVTYTFTIDADDPAKGVVAMHIDAVINGNNCAFDLSGSAEGMVLSNDIFWTCFLDGSMNVNGTVYDNVLSCMNKLDSDDLYVITITPPSQIPTHLKIGELHIPPEKYKEIQSKTVCYNPEIENINLSSSGKKILPNKSTDVYEPIPNSIFSIIGNSFTHFSYQNMAPYYSQRARACYASGYNRLSVSLKTYCSELNNYMKNNSAYYDRNYLTGIEYANISLSRNNTYDYSYIVGLEKLPYPFNQSHANANSLVWAIFSDVLSSYFGIPTETLSYFVSPYAEGEFTVDRNTDYASVSMTTPVVMYINFDSLDCGMPIVFQLSRSQPGFASYTYSTSTVYKTQISYPVYDHMTGVILYYNTYIDRYVVGTASGNVQVELI